VRETEKLENMRQ